MTSNLLLVSLITVPLLAVTNCDQLYSSLPNSETAPEVQVGSLQLVDSPPIEKLAAYYCPKISSDPAVQVACTFGLGSPPPRSQLTFTFGIGLDIHNPNDIPVPTADVLVALTLFKDANSQALGAICISLCGSDNPDCDGTPRPGACTAKQGDIFTIDDFINAIPGLIHDLATGQALDDLRNSTILAGGDIHLNLQFILGIDEALKVFEKTARAYVDAELDGRDGSLDIPVSVEGSVFFDLPVLGRLGVDYGPFSTVWKVL